MYIKCSSHKSPMSIKKITICFILVVCLQTTQAQPMSICITSKFELPGLSLDDATEPLAYFVGIAEGVSTNYDLLPMQVEYFVQLGVSYVVIERSYADSFLYNQFLKTGDEKYIQGDVEWSEDMREALRKVYLINQSLTEERKIRFIGIDAPNYAGSIIKTLGHLFYDKNPTADIRPFVDSINALNKFPIYHFWKEIKIYNETFIGYVNDQYRNHKTSFENVLGKDFYHLKQIAENKASHFRPGERNKDMFTNMVRIYEDIPLKSSLFIFGSTHTSKTSKGSLASRTLKERSSPYIDHVRVISTHYEKSKSFYAGKETAINQSLLDYHFRNKKPMILMEIKKNLDCRLSIHNANQLGVLRSLSSDFDYLLLVENGKAINSLRKSLLSK